MILLYYGWMYMYVYVYEYIPYIPIFSVMSDDDTDVDSHYSMSEGYEEDGDDEFDD